MTTVRLSSAAGGRSPRAPAVVRIGAAAPRSLRTGTRALGARALGARALGARAMLAPVFHEIGLLSLEGQRRVLEYLLGGRCRGRARGLHVGGGAPQIERHQRAQQMLAMHDRVVMAQGELVDDARPEVIGKPEEGPGRVAQHERLTERVGRQDEIPDGAEIADAAAEGVEHRVHLERARLDERCARRADRGQRLAAAYLEPEVLMTV